MNIEIGNHVITSDPYNIIISKKYTAKKGKKAGEKVVTPIAYAPTIELAVKKLVNIKVRESDATTLRELADEIKAYHYTVKNAFDL